MDQTTLPQSKSRETTALLIFPALLLCMIDVHAQTGSEFVDPFIGTGKAGNCYPGAQAPFGMISWSPENVFPAYDDPYARPGYKYGQDSINGFAVTHIDGVGCPAAHDLPFMPALGPLEGSPVNDRRIYASRFRHENECASPGYYSVMLDDIRTEVALTVSERSGVASFTFPSSREAHVVFRPTNNANGIADGSFVIERHSPRMTGWIVSGGFCSGSPLASPYRLYFVAEFNRLYSASGIWEGEVRVPGGRRAYGKATAAYFTFDCRAKRNLMMRIGLSYVSVKNAMRNLRSEIPRWDFEGTRTRAERAWNDILGKITVKGSPGDRKVFTTALYHNMLQPSIFDDVNGEYTGFDDRIHTVPPAHHKYVNFSLWDTYRTTAQIQALLVPEKASDMASSLLLDALQGAPGGFPIWGFYNRETWIMNGYSALPFLSNLIAFGARDVDLPSLKRMMIRAADSLYPRGAKYIRQGYVPDTASKWNYCVSMTIEYSIDDFAASRVCAALGDSAGYRRLAARSQNVFNLFNPQTKYLQRKTESGSWVVPFDASAEEGFNEGNSAQYTWSIPHNVARLVDSLGGPKAAGERLDGFFSQILIDGWNTTQPYYWMGNEPCFGAPFLYNWTGTPWKSQELVKRIARSYDATPDGLPGDDDVGAMSAMYLFMSLGLYPSIPGVGGFVVTGPAFPEVTMRLAGGRTVHMVAENADSLHPYVSAMRIDGAPYRSTWLPLSLLKPGGTTELRFDMAARPDTAWGSAPQDAPPSFNTQDSR